MEPEPHGPPPAGILEPQDWQGLPHEVYLPTQGVPADGDVLLDVRTIGDGRQALPVYTALHVLASACGADTPWISVLSSRLPSLTPEVGADCVLIDAAMPYEPADTPAGTAPPSGDVEPAMLYAPSRPFRAGDEQAMLELQPIVGEQMALPVFSSPELLIAGCGQHQPWVSFPEHRLDEVRRSTGADVVFKDKALPEHVRHPPPESGQETQEGSTWQVALKRTSTGCDRSRPS